jgi:cobalt-zinc-cadmium efflux system outer membrane protein
MRLIHRAAVAAVLALIGGPSVWADSSHGPITADQAVREALTANVDLAAARLAIDVARGQLLQAGRLDNPEARVSLADDFAFNAEGERVVSGGFSQRFPITARLAREKDVARVDVAIAEAEVRDFVRGLVADVQRAFYATLAFDERIAVDTELIATVRHVEETTARRLELAEASAAEVSLLRIERLRLEQDVQRLSREREVSAVLLARLLGRSSSAVPQPAGDLDPGDVPVSKDATAPIADFSKRPDLDAARAEIERAEANRALVRTQVWEDWSAGVGVESGRDVFEAPIGTTRDTLLSLDVSVPLPLWNRQQGRIASTEAQLLRARRARDGLALRVEEEIRAAEARIRILRASVDTYEREILPEATRTRASFEDGYRQGLIGVAELLQAQRQYNETRSARVELLGELRQAAIEFDAARGTTPFANEFELDGGTR